MEHGPKRGEAVLVKADGGYWGQGDYMGFPVVFRAVNNGLIEGQPSVQVAIFDAPRQDGPMPEFLRVPFIDDAPVPPLRLERQYPDKLVDDPIPDMRP